MDALARSLKTLGDPTRLRILRLLSTEALSVGELTAILGLAQPSVSKQLGALKRAGLVREERDGGYAFHQLDEDGGRLWPTVAEELTISLTTFDANPAASLPPPPADVQRKEKGGPSYVEHDVAPRILNGADVAELLERNYPRVLREAGVQGTVILWVYVDSEGRPGDCLVHSSSGYPMLDEAAEKVAAHMRFAPAQLMDKPVAVWIAQPFEFSLRTR